ncbi:protein RIC-3 [Gastrophryne carolinensis]
MALSAIQKVALFSGLVLCVSLLLPKTFLSRGKQSVQQEGNGGRFPSATPHGKPADGRNPGTFFPRSHLSEAVAKAKTGGGGGGGRQSLVGQIIPIYGFGILLYILYILFKLSSKGKNGKMEPKSVPIGNGNLKRKITDYELSQLQDKLRETEEAMEKMIARLGPDCQRENVSTDEEQQLLQRLKEITRVMKEGKVLDGVTPEQEAEEAPYMEDWEGYPEETFPVYDPSDARRKHDTILVDRSLLTQRSAEEAAEEMGFGEDEDPFQIQSSGEDQHDGQGDPAHNALEAESEECCSSDDDDDDETDPAVIAENAGFSSDSGGEGDRGAADPSAEAIMAEIHAPVYDDSGTLRKRGKKGSE